MFQALLNISIQLKSDNQFLFSEKISGWQIYIFIVDFFVTDAGKTEGYSKSDSRPAEALRCSTHRRVNIRPLPVIFGW